MVYARQIFHLPDCVCTVHDYQHVLLLFDQCVSFKEGRIFNFHLNYNLMENLNTKENKNLNANLSINLYVGEEKKKRVQSAVLGGRNKYPPSLIMESVGPYLA